MRVSEFIHLHMCVCFYLCERLLVYARMCVWRTYMQTHVR